MSFGGKCEVDNVRLDTFKKIVQQQGFTLEVGEFYAEIPSVQDWNSVTHVAEWGGIEGDKDFGPLMFTQGADVYQNGPQNAEGAPRIPYSQLPPDLQQKVKKVIDGYMRGEIQSPRSPQEMDHHYDYSLPCNGRIKDKNGNIIGWVRFRPSDKNPKRFKISVLYMKVDSGFGSRNPDIGRGVTSVRAGLKRGGFQSVRDAEIEAHQMNEGELAAEGITIATEGGEDEMATSGEITISWDCSDYIAQAKARAQSGGGRMTQTTGVTDFDEDSDVPSGRTTQRPAGRRTRI